MRDDAGVIAKFGVPPSTFDYIALVGALATLRLDVPGLGSADDWHVK